MIQRRTPLKRSTKPLKRTPLKRTGLKRLTYAEVRARQEKKKAKPPTSQQLRREKAKAWRADRKQRLWNEPGVKVCEKVHGGCGEIIRSFADAELDHIIPGKSGGCMIDTDENTCLKHRWCNRKKGSKRL